ncbi:hypothetical protein HMPREF0454_02389, partial [Hafnia alvei ATCC 51873]
MDKLYSNSLRWGTKEPLLPEVVKTVQALIIGADKGAPEDSREEHSLNLE